MAEEFFLTQEAYDELEQELKVLKGQTRNEVAAEIKEAKSFGDLSENSEYDSAKEKQGKTEARIKELEYTLQHSTIIDEAVLNTGTVHIGLFVTTYDPEFNEESKYRIVGAPQANPLEGKISDESPIGKALLGHKVGDVVDVETPGGILKLEIRDISRD